MAFKIRGYASVFRNVDSYGEVVDPGAFVDWLAENRGKSIPILYYHDAWGWLPVGKTTLLREDNFGLYYEADIITETQVGQEVAALVAEGVIEGASFAFRTLDEYKEDDIWHLAKLELREISVVLWGANPKAYVEPAPAEGGESTGESVPTAAELAALIEETLQQGA